MQCGRKADDGRKRAGPFKRAAIAALASFHLLASEPMIAKADPPKTSVSAEVGAGVDALTKETRLRAIFSLKTPISKRVTLTNSIGVFGDAFGKSKSAGLEEFTTDLNIALAGPLSLSLIGSKSRHGAIDKYSLGAELQMAEPPIFFFAGGKYLFDAGQVPVYMGITASFFREKLQLGLSGGYVLNCATGIAGASLVFCPKAGYPAIVVDSFNLVGRDGKPVFSDVVLSLRIDL